MVDTISVGASVRLVTVSSLAKQFGMSTADFHDFCDKLFVRIVRLKGEAYISLWHLEEALWNLSEGIAMPEASRRARMEVAGLLYGTLTTKILRERAAALIDHLSKTRVKHQMVTSPMPTPVQSSTVTRRWPENPPPEYKGDRVITTSVVQCPTEDTLATDGPEEKHNE